jgi:hypothetical protein
LYLKKNHENHTFVNFNEFRFILNTKLYLPNQVDIKIEMKLIILFLFTEFDSENQCLTNGNNPDNQTCQPNPASSWHNHLKDLRSWENINTFFDIPRFLVLRNASMLVKFFLKAFVYYLSLCCIDNDCFIISSLHLLLNSPVFNQTISHLKTAYPLFNTPDYDTLFCDLINVVSNAHVPYEDDETDSKYFKLLRKRLEQNFANGIQQDADEALILFMDVIHTFATSKNQADRRCLKAFYTTCFVSTDGGEPTSECLPAIRITDTNLTLKELVDTQFTGIIINQTDMGRTMQRIYQSLPDQLLFICDRKRNGSAVYYSYPVEFTRIDGLHYKFSGAIIHTGESLNSGHYITVVNRQDYVYILDDQYVAGGFHIDHLTSNLEKVNGTLKRIS